MQYDKLFSNEAEAGVLGSMIQQPDCIGEIINIIDAPEMFFKAEHRTIYETIVTLFAGDNPIDGLTIRTELKNTNQLEKIGGLEYLKRVVESVPTAANAVYYAGIVKDRYKYRQLIDRINRIQQIPDNGEKVDSQIQELQNLAFELEQDNSENGVFSLAESIETLEAENESEIYQTGLRNIDSLIEGFRPGELVILAARPAMGKSALALQLALNLANSGNPVVYFTLEMTNTELAKRATQSRDINREHRDNLIINQRANTPEKVAAFVKTARKAGKADAVFIDYLQLMSSGKKSESRVQEITAISRQLKRLAVNENVPVIALSQLNRQVENRENHRPRLSDLRDSGSIEQDADLVIMLSRQDYYRKNENPDTEQDGIAELIITKNRRGQTGIAQLIFLDEYVKFGDKTYI